MKTNLFVAVTTAFITTFMGSALNLSIPSIENEFQVSAANVGWIITIYMLTCAALAVPFGKVADMVDRKIILRFGILIFALSSGMAVISKEMWVLLLFRFIQGIGASMIFSTNIAILVDAADENQRGKVLGLVTSSTYVGLSAGPVVGGILNYNFGWRSVFLAAAAVSIAAFFCALKKVPQKNSSKKTEKKSFDKAGSILYLSSIVTLMYGLSEITASSWAWIFLAVGAGLMVWFVRAELSAANPIIQVRTFKNNLLYAFSNLSALLNYGANFAVSYLISIYLQVVTGLTSQSAGMVLITSPLVMALLSPVMGRLSDRYSPNKIECAGMAVSGVALGCFAFLPDNCSIIFIIGILFLSGVGFAAFSTPNANAVMASVDKEYYGSASSVLATMRSIGHTASMAVVTLIVSLSIGTQKLAESQPQQVLNTIHYCFYVFTGLCIIGFFALIFVELKKKI